MYKLAAPLNTQINEKLQADSQLPSGHLLINAADEIIYANKQARHFLGLLADEALPAGQKFLSLVQAAYYCYPAFAWHDWPKRPSVTTARYLIFSPPRRTFFLLLKVEIVEQIEVDGCEIWVVAIDLVKSTLETAVVHATNC